jgi:hypothetical protein
MGGEYWRKLNRQTNINSTELKKKKEIWEFLCLLELLVVKENRGGVDKEKGD